MQKIRYGTGFNIFFGICWFMGFLMALGYFAIVGFSLDTSGLIIMTGTFLLALVVQVIVLYLTMERFVKKTHSSGAIISMLASFTLGVPFLLAGGCIIIFSGI